MGFTRTQILTRILCALSIWGAVQLGLMGLAYNAKSPLMHLDVVRKQPKDDFLLPPEIYLSKVYDLYANASRRCFLAAILYLLLLSFLAFLPQTPLTRSTKR